jgi:large exoprotein involved in heme utilization and adhesion
LLWALVGLGVVGSVDIAQFVATNQGMFSTAPGRAAGSVAGLVLWIALTAAVALAAAGVRAGAALRISLWLAWLLAIGSVGLAVIHAAAHVGGLRPGLGAVLAVLELILIVGVRSRHWGAWLEG